MPFSRSTMLRRASLAGMTLITSAWVATEYLGPSSATLLRIVLIYVTWGRG